MSTTSHPRASSDGREVGWTEALSDALVRTRRFFTKGEVSDDLRTLHQTGGREADDFYRDRWSHDKVVRSTHGVNCTGSCSWKVYVKDGIITWETQQTDYPSVGPGQAGVRAPRLPARRGVLLVHLLADPGPLPLRPRRAAADVPRGEGAARRRPGQGLGAHRRQPPAGQGLQVRARQGRPGPRDAGTRPPRWSPPPTCTRSRSGARTGSPASRRSRRCRWSPTPPAPGSPRCVGGSMLSFYDWYADLPVASPQVFGDQTDVPGVRRLVGRRLPDHVGLEPAGHPHPGRALDDRGALPRPEGRRGLARLRRQREVRRRVARRRARAPTARWRWRWAT